MNASACPPSTVEQQNARLKGVKVVKPVLLGSVAWYLGKKREDGRTHQWTVYLRSYDHEDLSLYLRRVQFRLHDSFPDPTRVFTSPPYSVTETGWGEFEITVKLFFVDNCERPVTMYHFLKLFHREPDGTVRLSPEPVLVESYDELVFVEPSKKLFLLLNHPRMTAIPAASSGGRQDYEVKKETDLQRILEARMKVKEEVAELRSRLTRAKEEILKLRAEVSAQ